MLYFPVPVSVVYSYSQVVPYLTHSLCSRLLKSPTEEGGKGAVKPRRKEEKGASQEKENLIKARRGKTRSWLIFILAMLSHQMQKRCHYTFTITLKKSLFLIIYWI